jgi:hypothetical protein
MWIYRNLAEWRDLNASAVVREWVNGESFLYLGCNYRLSLVSGQTAPLKLKDGRFCLQRELVEAGGPAAASRAFIQFYREKGLARITTRVNSLAAKTGVVPGAIKVRGLGYRWASCTRNSDLAFHWKCMMAPPKVLDYIILHELCHIHHRNHTDAFWNEVDKVMPDYQERKEWLRRHGAGLDL